MDPKEKLRLIKHGLGEVLNIEIIEHALFEEKRDVKIYWGKCFFFT